MTPPLFTRFSMKARRIGVLTAGGDCPGLNAVIRAVVKTAVLTYGWEVVGIKDGFDGLIGDEASTVALTTDSVQGILALGGTILGAASRTNPFLYTRRQQGNRILLDVTPRVLERIQELELDAVVVIGGDGTMRIARELHDMGAPLVGVPKTIDNDVDGTDVSFGFDTAVGVATEAIDRLRTTAASHHRAMIVEVMGRHSGWIALHSGVAGGADVVLIPEFPFDVEVIYRRLQRCFAEVQRSAIVVVAEGAYPAGGQTVFRNRTSSQDKRQLGGIGEYLAELLHARQEQELSRRNRERLRHPRHRARTRATRRHAQQHRPRAGYSIWRCRRATGGARQAWPHGGAARRNLDRSTSRTCRPRASHRPFGLRSDPDGT